MPLLRRRLVIQSASSVAGCIVSGVFVRDAYADTGDIHFYTTSIEERDFAGQHDYRQEGVLGYIIAPSPPVASKSAQTQTVSFNPPLPNLLPLFRAFHPQRGNHFFTTTLSEWTRAIKENEYLGEGVIGWLTPNDSYQPPSGSVLAQQTAGQKPSIIYRLFESASDDHFYTLNKSERDAASGRYAAEPFTGCAYSTGPNPATGTAGTLTPLYRMFQPGSSDKTFWQDVGKVAQTTWLIARDVAAVSITIFTLSGVKNGETKVSQNPDGGIEMTRPVQ